MAQVRTLVNGAVNNSTGSGRHDKIRIFKMRRHQALPKHQGHRQNYANTDYRCFSLRKY
ncbi:MAG: bL21 family ribosomal protein [Rhodoferax sp.]|nr:bL21 family ribosomal protein [Rhodoferax sp.]